MMALYWPHSPVWLTVKRKQLRRSGDTRFGRKPLGLAVLKMKKPRRMLYLAGLLLTIKRGQ